MKLWKSLFDGTKEQRQKQEDTSKLVHDKKNEFTANMLKIQEQSRRAHQKSREAYKENQRLADIVESVTKNLAIASGGLRGE